MFTMNTAKRILSVFFITSVFFAPNAFSGNREEAIKLINDSYDPTYRVVSTAKVSQSKTCLVDLVTLGAPDPIEKTEQSVVLRVYKSAKPLASKPALVLLHPINGVNKTDQKYGVYFCDLGYDVFIVDSWYMDNEESLDFELHDRASLRALAAIRHAVEYINRPHIGLLGNSLGAIHGALVLAVEPRIKAGVLIVGGAPLADVLAYSKQDRVDLLREMRMEKFGLVTQDEYRVMAESKIRINVVDLIDSSAPDRLMMSLSIEDKSVPSPTQQSLWKMFGEPSKIEGTNNHVFTILKSYNEHRGDFAAFFENKLK